MKIRNKYTKVLLAFVMGVMFTCLYISPLKASASEEEIAANVLLSLTQDTVLMEEADSNSNPVGELSAGTPVISTEAAADGWIKIMYQDMTGYIPLSSIGVQADEELNAEFEQISNENRLVFDVVEHEKEQGRQKLIWGVVIGVLVAAIFIVGIVSAVRANRKKSDR